LNWKSKTKKFSKIKIQNNVKRDRVRTWNGRDNFSHLKPIWKKWKKLIRKIANWMSKMQRVWRSIQRMVVFPALSRPRTRIRASLLPKTDENNLVNTNPIFRFGGRGIMIRTWIDQVQTIWIENSSIILKSDRISKQKRREEVHVMRFKD